MRSAFAGVPVVFSRVRELDADEAKKFPVCNLTKSQYAMNVGVPAAVAAVASLASLAGPVVSALSMFVPVPMVAVQPYISKTVYHMGLMHTKQECLDHTGVRATKTKWLGLREDRGVVPVPHTDDQSTLSAKNTPSGCYVWQLMMFDGENNVRITAYGPGNESPRVFEGAGGTLVSTLEAADGALVLTLTHVSPTGEVSTQSVPVNVLDGVQYTACGPRPKLIKYHVLVGADGRVQAAEPKRPKESTWAGGVDGADRGTNERRERIYDVQPDGAAGKGAVDHYTTNDDGSKKSLATRTWYSARNAAKRTVAARHALSLKTR